ncbi:hypothetical protein Clacol_008979 [Clathrus columnatus]|uniref:BZIP domain-containing protein n=1 Tax=Clathrus columnatus TaxID=1419009 RepID=A0AAV5ALZ1_9AGAM|nr:hypothetical protein Clacol_008979 [Clathrus columnatus]
MSSTLLTSPPDIWAGKSRNAKAQARHRAKRKAYIEQLEQTVSKLQTALALSAEDVVNLPTTQMKLRELKEENDSLRAELRKFQLQQAANFSMSSVIPMPSNEPPRLVKRRRLSSDDSEHRYTYLASISDSVGHDMEHAPTSVSVVPSGRSMPLSTGVQNRNYQLQGPGGLTVPETSQTTHLREEPFSWTPYTVPTPSSGDSPPSWSYSGGHDGVTNEMVSLYAADMNGNSSSAQRTELDINTLNISSSGSWPDVQIWPYSAVRPS